MHRPRKPSTYGLGLGLVPKGPSTQILGFRYEIYGSQIPNNRAYSTFGLQVPSAIQILVVGTGSLIVGHGMGLGFGVLLLGWLLRDLAIWGWGFGGGFSTYSWSVCWV